MGGHSSWQPQEIECIRRVVDTIPGLVWSAGPDGSAEFLNKRWLDYTGLTHEAAVEFGWQAVMHSDDLPGLIGAFVKANDSRESFAVESRIRRYDGVYRWFLMQGSPLIDDSGTLVQWYGINTDIEDRKRAEEILRTSEQTLRETLDSIPGLVCTMSPAGKIEFFNNRIREYFGQHFDSLNDWATTEAVHPDDIPRVVAAWYHSVETGEAYDIEHRARRADGTYRWFQIRALPSRDSDGRILRWNCLLTDIDQRKQAEIMLQRSEKYLAEAQKLTHCGSWSLDASTHEALWSEEWFRILAYDPADR